MTQRCLDCTAGLLDRWAYREGDSELQQQTKRILVLFLTVTSAASLVGFAGTIDHESPIRHYMPLFIFMFLAELGYLRVTRDAGERFIYVFTVSLTVTIMVNDIVSAVEAGRRMWPFAILLVDILLVIRASPALTIGVVSSMCVFMTVMQLEAALRIGLFDLVVFAPYEHRDGFEACAKPPCQGNSAFLTYMSGLLITMSVFLLDFYFTRGFALQVRREKEKIAAAVTAAEQVAERLALLDLDAAEEVLEHSEDVPPGLCDSLQVILSHLRGYKPFLPQAVLMPALGKEKEDSSVSSDARQLSSLSSGRSTGSTAPVVFRLQMQRLSLLRLKASLPAISDPSFLPLHSRMLEAVLQEAAACNGVVDNFGGDVLSLSYNTSASCARHPMMAVQTAATLCLDAPQGLCRLTGAVVTGKAHVGVLGVPSLRRHCIVGSLETECQNIVRGAQILGHRLLCSHRAAVDVDSTQQTRVLLDRFVFDVPLRAEAGKALSSVVHEVLPCVSKENSEHVDGEWMYELATLSTDEWDAYNKAGVAFVCGCDSDDVLKILSDAGVIGEKVSLFQAAAAAATTLDFGTAAVPVHRP
eukprot:Rhum_TRINITY_DN15268_c3_g1::Rhum_TRINITY_DN15268_c3_g1_i11::g.147532::m.147532